MQNLSVIKLNECDTKTDSLWIFEGVTTLLHVPFLNNHQSNISKTVFSGYILYVHINNILYTQNVVSVHFWPTDPHLGAIVDDELHRSRLREDLRNVELL